MTTDPIPQPQLDAPHAPALDAHTRLVFAYALKAWVRHTAEDASKEDPR